MAQETLESANQPQPLPAGLSIWPPSQRTRDAVVLRLVETLTNPSSILSKRYGVVLSPEAESVAQSIEKEALSAVSTASSTDSLEEGLKAITLYSKAVSERLMSFSKSRVAKDDVTLSNGVESLKLKDEEEDTGSVVNSEALSA